MLVYQRVCGLDLIFGGKLDPIDILGKIPRRIQPADYKIAIYGLAIIGYLNIGMGQIYRSPILPPQMALKW